MADALQSINVVDLEIGVRLQCACTAPCLSLLPLASAFRCGLTVVEVDRTRPRAAGAAMVRRCLTAATAADLASTEVVAVVVVAVVVIESLVVGLVVGELDHIPRSTVLIIFVLALIVCGGRRGVLVERPRLLLLPLFERRRRPTLAAAARRHASLAGPAAVVSRLEAQLPLHLDHRVHLLSVRCRHLHPRALLALLLPRPRPTHRLGAPTEVCLLDGRARRAHALDHCDQRCLRCGRLAQLLDAAAARASCRPASSLVLRQVGRATLERCGRHRRPDERLHERLVSQRLALRCGHPRETPT
mmetsp:Transcript_764/g.1903  ORF Transcript_764/g.1903 Transcript_764/m.1903 type:complete len:302 (-) Transcript_764:312-1217(-)